MLLRDKTTGTIHRARIAPLAWTVVVEHGDGEEVYEVPTCSPDDYDVEIVSASPEEVAAMREHGILPEGPLLVMEDDRGRRHVVHLDFAPLLRWADGSARGPEDFPGRIVEASAAGVAILRRFSLELPGLPEVEKRQRRLARRANAPGRRIPQRSPGALRRGPAARADGLHGGETEWRKKSPRTSCRSPKVFSTRRAAMDMVEHRGDNDRGSARRVATSRLILCGTRELLRRAGEQQ